MRKNIILTLLCLVFSVVMLFAGCATQKSPASPSTQDTQTVEVNKNIVKDIKARGQLVVGCKTDVPNLGWYESDTDRWEGLEVDLAYATAAKIFDRTVEEVKAEGLVKLVPVTVADREEKLQDGSIDIMMATFTITDARKQTYALSDPYYKSYIGIMVNYNGSDSNSLGTGDIRSLSDLDGKYIGIPRNATTREDFISYLDMMNTVKVSPIFSEYDSYPTIYKALKNGNVDAMAVDISILKGYETSSTKILDIKFKPQNYGAAVMPQNAPLIDYVNDAIETIK